MVVEWVIGERLRSITVRSTAVLTRLVAVSKSLHRLTGFVFVKFVCVTREKRIGP